MKNTSLILAGLLAAGTLFAATENDKKAGSTHAGHAGSMNARVKAPARKALKLRGKRYGHGVTLTETTSIAELLANPDAYQGKRVRIEGKVTDVCPKAGCWLNVRGKGSPREVTFKVQDGVIVFPMSAKGKSAILEGIVSKQDLDLKTTRGYLGHLAEEKGEDFDPASITEPMTLVRVKGSGAVLR